MNGSDKPVTEVQKVSHRANIQVRVKPVSTHHAYLGVGFQGFNHSWNVLCRIRVVGINEGHIVEIRVYALKST